MQYSDCRDSREWWRTHVPWLRKQLFLSFKIIHPAPFPSAGAGPGRTSTASCGKEAWASTRTTRAPAVASRTMARCPSAWGRRSVRLPATTRRGNTSSNWGGQKLEERREETEKQRRRRRQLGCETCCLTVGFFLSTMCCLQAWRWERVSVPSEGWGKTFFRLKKSVKDNQKSQVSLTS